MTFKRLYKLTSTGKIQEWDIATVKDSYTTVHGTQDGKKQVTTTGNIKGKNIGKANETSPKEQAELEAGSKWKKKLGKDYFETIAEAQAQSRERVANDGGYLPMLAQSYSKHANKLRYPCTVQPKLDGLRCIVTRDEIGAHMWLRSGKPITTMGYIEYELFHVMNIGDIFDGELYSHTIDFNAISGAVRRDEHIKKEIAKQIEFHIYDVPRIGLLKETDSFVKRFDMLILQSFKYELRSLKFVERKEVYSFDSAVRYYQEWMEAGYEGMMFRNSDMPYEQKRSYNLLKYKEFVDDEFIIIGALEGKGNDAGTVGSFICKIEAGKTIPDMNGKEYTHTVDCTVKAKLKGSRERRKYLFENPDEYLGKQLTIKYFCLSEDGIPRFPVGKEIRFDKT